MSRRRVFVSYAGLIPGGSYTFELRGADLAGNISTLTRHFTVG